MAAEEPDAEELIRRSWADYSKALELLESGDAYDAAEKAWSAIESMRKACLVAAKIPYSIAKSVRDGVPLFSKVLEALGERELVRMYFYFNSRLHALGFYERIVPEEDVARTIREEVGGWLRRTEALIDVLKRVDLSGVAEVLSEINKVRQEVLRASTRYAELRNKLDSLIESRVSSPAG